MAHSDDKGLVLPPRLAPKQVVIIPIISGDSGAVLEVAAQLNNELKAKGIVSTFDTRENLRPGAKFFEWEKRGVPIRVELGPKDLEKNQCVAVRRDTGEKMIFPLESAPSQISKLLDEIQISLLDHSRKFREDNTFEVSDYKKFTDLIETHPGFYSAGWCGSAECEEKIKEETKATIRCIPFDSKKEKSQCLYCGKAAKHKAVFAHAY
jgi:prolyl-tRNA synthetase